MRVTLSGKCERKRRGNRLRWARIGLVWAGAVWIALVVAGCGGEREEPTRTPVPTFTPTPLGMGEPAVAAADGAGAAPTTAPAQADAQIAPTLPPTVAPTATPTPLPPTATPTPTPTDTPAPTDTPTPSPTPTAPPDYTFVLEAAEKFPTESLAPNVVRIYLYVYAPDTFALPGYRLSVIHNGAELPIDGASTGGLPEQTRSEPGPYTRFTNMNVIFVEAQAGEWVIQLLGPDGEAVGPPATFDLSADETTRELYVRYQQQPEGS